MSVSFANGSLSGDRAKAAGCPGNIKVVMAMLMIICPIAHRALSTGVEVEPSKFESLLDVPRTAACPHCGGAHVWHKREAWLADPEFAGPDLEPTNAPGSMAEG